MMMKIMMTGENGDSGNVVKWTTLLAGDTGDSSEKFRKWLVMKVILIKVMVNLNGEKQCKFWFRTDVSPTLKPLSLSLDFSRTYSGHRTNWRSQHEFQISSCGSPTIYMISRATNFTLAT